MKSGKRNKLKKVIFKVIGGILAAGTVVAVKEFIEQYQTDQKMLDMYNKAQENGVIDYEKVLDNYYPHRLEKKKEEEE
jgi:hypothetical protein